MSRRSASFLDRIRKVRGDGDYPGDRFGGGDGDDGSGLPTGGMGESFVFATGIECSNPTIQRGRIRRDELAECGHYDRWKEDFALAHALGVRCLRYGLPIHRVWLGPDRYDWEFADAALGELRRLDIRPVLDLIHFGAPDWIGDFQNPDLPLLFADYCAAVADRYPWIRSYTPVNEAFVTARNSARDGLWNEQLKSDRAFVTAIKHLTAASIMGCQAIAERRHDAIIVQSESAEYIHRMQPSIPLEDRIRDKLKFLALDLLYARCVDAEVLLFAFDNGLTRDEYEWFMRGEPPGYQVLGIDYYGRNECVIAPDGRKIGAPNALGWRQIAHEYWARYRKPLMHTETNAFDAREAPAWLWKQWVNVLHVRSEGVPVLGFTWYSLTDQIDWDIQLARKRGRVNTCGLYTLDRTPNPVARDFRQLLEQFGRISLMPHAEMLTVTDRAAHLKVER